MNILALKFPEVSQLFYWPDFAFQGTPLAMNKTVLIYLAALVLTLWVFLTAGADGKKYVPFLTTMFFFIFFSNIFEVVPFIQFPANAKMSVPLALSLMVWVIYNYLGVKNQGFFGYMKNSLFPPGVPKALYLIVTPIEFFSVFIIRPLSLAIRLWANMVAGHLLLVTFAVLSATLWDSTYVGAIAPAAMLVIMTAFEIVVSFLQAFIFTILTAVYMGGAIHPEH